eukprot:Nitzschia sp. Nitz4//scaffold80_size88189//41204//41596//NITZ4_005087-RA/size88189-processed-gene-0.15-mRNA-1//1//CDS//3329558630//370//frame0
MSSPPSSSDWFRKIASCLGATGVTLGAIGAHAFKDILVKRGTLANWQTATVYQLFHATAILTMAESSAITPMAGNLMALGTTMFSGSIYLLCLGIGPKAVLGPTTPLGGILMIGGWVMVGLSSSTSKKDA